MVKEIELTQNQITIVDDDDYEYLKKYKWRLLEDQTGATIRYYAQRHLWLEGKRSTLTIHREVMNCPIGLVVDHINGNGLDNRKQNLRVVTHRKNMQNMYCHRQGKLVGVSFHKRNKKYMANIKINGTAYNIGSYSSEQDGHNAYMLASEMIENGCTILDIRNAIKDQFPKLF